MRKIFLMLALIVIAITTNAQNNAKVSINLGNEFALPVGTLTKNYTAAFGGSGQIECQTNKNYAYTITAGFLNYVRKTSVMGTYGEFPVLGGVKVFLNKLVYLGSSAGVTFIQNSNQEYFTYSSGLGVKLKDFNVDLKFTSAVRTHGQRDLSNIGVRAAYRF